MDEETTQFRRELKVKLIEWLQLEDKTADDIKDDEALFGTGLGLDSHDAVEMVIALKREDGSPQTEVDKNREIFMTFASFADFVQKNRR